MATILIVDDIPANLRVLNDNLGETYDIRAARSGARALAVARSRPRPDLILLDVMMPGMDGHEVLRRLKSDPVTADIPVIFVTALDSVFDEARGLTLGAVDYITKPIRPAILHARVRTHLELAAARQRARARNLELEAEIARRMEETLITQNITVRALGILAEMRDPGAGDHLCRTQGFVRVLAERLSRDPMFSAFLAPESIEVLVRSAPLHDIGKLGIPAEILLKPGKLDAREWSLVKGHSRLGREAIELAERGVGRSTAFLRTAKDVAYYHHERWDGTGYPEGLARDRIPLSARLMALADVFDALISTRSYKEAHSFDDAVDIISQGRGGQFDPGVVDAFRASLGKLREVVQSYPQRNLALLRSC